VTDIRMKDQRQYEQIHLNGQFGGNYADVVLKDQYVTMVELRLPKVRLEEIVELCDMLDRDKMNAATMEAFNNFYLLYKMSKHYDSSIAQI
jgi:RES domain-containing protein